MMKTACELWKSGIDIWKNSYAIFDNHAARYSTMINSYVAKIQKYQGNYSFTRPQYSGFPSIYITVASKNSNSDFGVGYSSSGTSSSSSGGCYVATAVYGSYDCPQVWTLRRFRDYTLAETWYGRAFIHTYYAISPTLVKWFGHTEWFKKMWKGKLDRMVANLKADGVEDTPYEDKVW